MVKRNIVWTETAMKQRRHILAYWIKRNGSTKYAEKLIQLIKEHLKVILNNPQAFKTTDYKDVRESALGHFSIYYRFTDKQIIVMAFWDNRQSPKKLLKSILENKNI